jgi:hypothetical protein
MTPVGKSNVSVILDAFTVFLKSDKPLNGGLYFNKKIMKTSKKMNRAFKP